MKLCNTIFLFLNTGQLIEENLKLVEQLPRGYRPWGIYRVLSQVYQAVIRSLMLLMSE